MAFPKVLMVSATFDDFGRTFVAVFEAETAEDKEKFETRDDFVVPIHLYLIDREDSNCPGYHDLLESAKTGERRQWGEIQGVFAIPPILVSSMLRDSMKHGLKNIAKWKYTYEGDRYLIEDESHLDWIIKGYKQDY